MLVRTCFFGLVALALMSAFVGGCSDARGGDCRCEGSLPDGTRLDLACGESVCTGGSTGFECVGPNEAVTDPSACDPSRDGGVRDGATPDEDGGTGECTCAGRECGGDGCGGTCGSCGSGRVCSDGTCIAGECPGDTRECDGECSDLVSDPRHCGRCDVECPSVPNARPVCTEASCGIECDAGFQYCETDSGEPECRCYDDDGGSATGERALTGEIAGCEGSLVLPEDSTCEEGGTHALIRWQAPSAGRYLFASRYTDLAVLPGECGSGSSTAFSCERHGVRHELGASEVVRIAARATSRYSVDVYGPLQDLAPETVTARGDDVSVYEWWSPEGKYVGRSRTNVSVPSTIDRIAGDMTVELRGFRVWDETYSERLTDADVDLTVTAPSDLDKDFCVGDVLASTCSGSFPAEGEDLVAPLSFDEPAEGGWSIHVAAYCAEPCEVLWDELALTFTGGGL